MEQAGAVYLDVRSPEEFASGHPAGAHNVPWQFITAQGSAENPRFLEQVRALFPRDTKLVVGCKSGVRSLKAATLLSEHFADVVEQRAGTDGVTDPFGRVREPGWRAAGLPWSL
jgi:rhodanese-related sulfurtransferase